MGLNLLQAILERCKLSLELHHEEIELTVKIGTEDKVGSVVRSPAAGLMDNIRVTFQVDTRLGDKRGGRNVRRGLWFLGVLGTSG